MADCPLCNNSGLILEGDLARPCECIERRRLDRRLALSHLTPLLRTFTFDRFSFRYYSPHAAAPDRKYSYLDAAKRAHRAALEFCDRYAQDGGTEGMLIQGGVGSGKTYLACCIANRLLEDGHRVLFLVVPEFLDQIRSSYDVNGNGTKESDLMEGARDVPVLILDDLGAHQYTDWSRQKIYSLVNYRVNHQLPVIVTTNITDLSALYEHLGERTVSRLLQMCQLWHLAVEIDIRIIKRKESERTSQLS
ncbi:MAG: ATP-binding protein [Clostridia bacterium]|nr:ATP-binding protein [Clostridia bacterium]